MGKITKPRSEKQIAVAKRLAANPWRRPKLETTPNVYSGFVKGQAPMQLPTPSQRKFVDKYVKTGNATQSYREVYGDKGANTGHYAWVVMKSKHVQALIRQVEERLVSEATGSIDKMAELRDSADMEKTQLGAAKGLMDAYAALMIRQAKAMEPTEGSTTNILVTSMTDADIIARLAKLSGDQGIVPGAPPEKV